jgi:predicted transcriptional regulator
MNAKRVEIPEGVLNDDLLSLDAVRIYVQLSAGVVRHEEIAKRVNLSTRAVARRIRELMLAKHVEEVRDRTTRERIYRLPAMELEFKMTAA